MIQLNWPIIHRHRSQNALDHLASLEADFEALDACVKLSESKHHRLPSSLQKDISKGIFEALSDHDYPYEISEADKTLIGGLFLKHITAEAAERARDRIPLRQYHGLRKSVQGLVTKLNTEGSQPHPGAMTGRDERGANNLIEPSPELQTTHAIEASFDRQSEAVQPTAGSNGNDTLEGAGQAESSKGRNATNAAIAIDQPKKKGRKRKKADEVKGNENNTHKGAEQADSSCGLRRDTTDAAIGIEGPKKKGRKRKKRDEVEGNEDATHEGAEQADSSQGQDAASAAIAIDQPKKKGRKRKKLDEVKQAKGEDKAGTTDDDSGILGIIDNQNRVQEMNVHEAFVDSGVETDDHEDLMRMFRYTEAQCEYIRQQLQDFDNGQLEDSMTWHVMDELMEDEDMAEKYVVDKDDAGVELGKGDTLVSHPSDPPQWPNDQADNQTQLERSQQFQQGRQMKQEVAGADSSSIITFNIEHQATVNQLYNMGSDGILQRLSGSLESMRSFGHDAPDFILFNNAMLLDNGNVEVHAYARSKEDIERLSKIRGWDLEFEQSIYAPEKSYGVKTSRIRVDSFNLQMRKHKATAIRELLEENLRFVVSLRGVGDIPDTRWCTGDKEESSLILEFRTAQQADEVLDSGILIRGKHYTCLSVDQNLGQCRRCQAFGHDAKSCLSAHRCGGCASQHPTSACKSNIRHCANCHGPHQAYAVACPAREAYKQRFRYTCHSSPVAKQEHEESAPEPQTRTAALNLPPPNPVPITSHDEREIEVKEHESLQSIGPVREHHLERAAAQRNTLMPANLQHEPYVKAEGSEPNQETSLAQSQSPDFILIQRQLDDLRRMVVERLSFP